MWRSFSVRATSRCRYGAAATYLQREVARNLRLRYTPHLRFVYDESVARGDRIERLLREARSQGEAVAGPADRSRPDDDEG